MKRKEGEGEEEGKNRDLSKVWNGRRVARRR